jgi:hypothetical protein
MSLFRHRMAQIDQEITKAFTPRQAGLYNLLGYEDSHKAKYPRYSVDGCTVANSAHRDKRAPAVPDLIQLTRKHSETESSGMNRRDLLRGSILCSMPFSNLLRDAGASEDDDTAAIYSALLATALRWLDPGDQLGLDMVTFAAKMPDLRVSGETKQAGSNNLGPLRPSITSPPDVAPTIAKMAADLVALRAPVPLPREITLPDYYLPMTPQDIHYYDEMQPSGVTYNNVAPVEKHKVPDDVVARFRNVKFLTSYSGIAFSPDRTLALVAGASRKGYMSEWYEILGKSNSSWHSLDWEMTTVSTSS